VRLKLAALYGGLFLIAGAVLLAVNFLLYGRHLFHNIEVPAAIRSALPSGTRVIDGSQPCPKPPSLCSAINEQSAVDALRARLRRQALERMALDSGLALTGMAVASVGLGWLVAGRVLRPLNAITEMARRASENDLTQRIALDGPADELKELADTLDGMLARLQAAFASQQRFAANVSHELLTPLATIRAAADVALAHPARSSTDYQQILRRVHRATDRAERLVESLLMLARSERGPTTTQPIDLSDAAAAALHALHSEALAAELTIEHSLQPAPTTGDAALLERLVANLIENGVRHNIAGGLLRVTTYQRNGAAIVQTSNTGPAIDAGQIPDLFEPFQRLDPPRTHSYRSAGLGLSIAKAITTAHSGTLTAQPRPGGGITITLCMPARAPLNEPRDV
jgi:signal transduction histidine kinase